MNSGPLFAWRARGPLCRSIRLRRIIRAIAWVVATITPTALLAADEASGRREQIGLERRQADAALEQRRLICRQRFVVTACIDDARASHRDALHALDREEAAIDSNLRHERAARRLEIIRDKTDALARLAPLPALERSPSPAVSAPLAPSSPSLLPSGSGADVRSGDTGQASVQAAARREAESAERAAAQRAAAAQQRRDDAARRRALRESKRNDRKKSSAGLAERPEIPPARLPSPPPASSSPSK